MFFITTRTVLSPQISGCWWNLTGRAPVASTISCSLRHGTQEGKIITSDLKLHKDKTQIVLLVYNVVWWYVVLLGSCTETLTAIISYLFSFFSSFLFFLSMLYSSFSFFYYPSRYDRPQLQTFSAK